MVNKSKIHNKAYSAINGIKKSTLLKMLNSMITIRKSEHKVALGRKKGLIGGPVHLSVGQEAIAVGISQNLKKTDMVFGAHRSHAHILALNNNYYKLFAEVLGKKTGFSKGMGGSMHLFDQQNGFYGSVPIVAGTVSLAVGAAISSNLKKSKNISLAYIGDGAVEEGVVHESFNLAKIQKAPVLFVIENNLFASHMHINLRQPSKIISRFAIANKIPYEMIDGNDVIKVKNKSFDMIKKIRLGKGPGILEFFTYRWYGHVDWRDDIDVGVERSLKDIEKWKKADPILRLSKAMISKKIWSERQELRLSNKIENQINLAWEKALNDPYPSKDAILKYVYAE